LAPWVIAHFPAHRVYIEPFGGAASVLMAKPRASVEVLNDLNADIVGLYRVLRDPIQAAELTRLLWLTPYARAEYKASFEPSPDPVEAARRLIVRSFMGFGAASLNTPRPAGFRVKWRGSYVSCSNTWAHYPDAIAHFTARLSGVTIECKPALDLIAQFDLPEVLLYCDPPYAPETRNMAHRSCRYPCDMTAEEHRALAALLHQSRSMVVLSGYPCALYAQLYPDWYRVTCQAWAEGQKARTECLWLNPVALGGLGQLALEMEEGQGQR
jgi:DNA adenine methylase